MVTAEELQRVELEKSFREFCERLVRNDKLGWTLRPSRLWARGGAVAPGQDIPDIEGTEFDRLKSGDLLKYLEAARKDFPELGKEYSAVLDKAEGTWKGIAERGQ